MIQLVLEALPGSLPSRAGSLTRSPRAGRRGEGQQTETSRKGQDQRSELQMLMRDFHPARF